MSPGKGFPLAFHEGEVNLASAHASSLNIKGGRATSIVSAKLTIASTKPGFF